MEEGVWRPDPAGQEVVEWQPLHRALEAQPLIFPALPEEHVDGVFLGQRGVSGVQRGAERWGSGRQAPTISVSDTGPKLVT